MIGFANEGIAYIAVMDALMKQSGGIVSGSFVDCS
jgi:hypothetical protein